MVHSSSRPGRVKMPSFMVHSDASSRGAGKWFSFRVSSVTISIEESMSLSVAGVLAWLVFRKLPPPSATIASR